MLLCTAQWNITDVTKPLRKCESYRLPRRDGDLPSHGTTSRNRGHIDSFDEYIEEVKLWVKEARKYRLPIFLFGHSMGGLIVIRMMQETREKM